MAAITPEEGLDPDVRDKILLKTIARVERIDTEHERLLDLLSELADGVNLLFLEVTQLKYLVQKLPPLPPQKKP